MSALGVRVHGRQLADKGLLTGRLSWRRRPGGEERRVDRGGGGTSNKVVSWTAEAAGLAEEARSAAWMVRCGPVIHALERCCLHRMLVVPAFSVLACRRASTADAGATITAMQTAPFKGGDDQARPGDRVEE